MLHNQFPPFLSFSTALWDLLNSRPVHSLMLSSHLFFSLPCLLSPFRCTLQDGFGQTWWTGDVCIPLQFASVYHGKEIFVWSDCLLDLDTGFLAKDFLVGNMVIVWDASRGSLWGEHRTRDRKVASSNPGRSGGRIFFSRVDFVCWLLFDVNSIPLLPQWHVKDPGHSAKSAGGRLHLTTHTPLTHRSRSRLTMPLSSHSVGTYQERAHMQLVMEHSATVVSARWATVDWSCSKELISVRELSPRKKKERKKEKRRRGMNRRTFSQKPRKRGKKPLSPPPLEA